MFLGGNPPFQPTANVSFGNVDNPGGTQANTLPLTVTTQSQAFKNPEAWNWNFSVEREFFFKSVLNVAYVGRRSLHQQREANINQPTPDVVAANPGVNLDALRPYKGYNSIRRTDNVANSKVLPLAFKALGMNGRLVTAGAHGGPNVMIDFAHLYHKKITIMGRTGHNEADIPKCFAAAAAGKLKAQIERLLPLSQAAEAHRLVESGEVPGKIVLDPTLDK